MNEVQVYAKKVEVENEGDGVLINIDGMDETLFFGQFVVSDVLDQLDMSNIIKYVMDNGYSVKSVDGYDD